MATWAKIKFFYATMIGSTGSTLTAGSTESTGDYSVDYLYNMLETTMWKANAVENVNIQYDAGVGNTKTADYVVIFGHNLEGGIISFQLEYSDDGSWTGEETVVVQENGIVGPVQLYEFAQTTAHRYWRVRTTGSTVTPEVTLLIWGNKTELDYASASFDPHAMTARASVNITQGGYMAGTHTKHIERSLALRFTDADSTLYSKVKAWWDTSGLKNFFVAWETGNSPSDVYLMRPDTRFNNPLTNGGSYRDIRISLKGRKE